MSPDQLENFHDSLLRVLDRNSSQRFGYGVTTLLNFVREFGYTNITVAQLEAAMAYLEDKEIGFVELVNKGQFNPANRCWKITARGINHLRERGF